MMMIHVENHSESVDPQELTEAISAVDAQVDEDFSHWWHVEGALAEREPGDLEPSAATSAVIYLTDDSDDSVLGWHTRNRLGVPYGVVLPRVSSLVGEPWPVALSHEVLEMLMDPWVNLVSLGPDPRRSGGWWPWRRGGRVFHWYEVCDAVQSRTYQKGGIEVSDFLTPLYFTEGEEEGSRTHFLDGELSSFGVLPGGYVGFYDPQTRTHETFAMDAEGDRRMARRKAIGHGRRAARRMGES